MASKITFTILLILATVNMLSAQPITGVWKGKVNNKRVEVKLIQKGDSIVGTAYYPGLLKDYKRYSIKGYFDPYSNSIVWWNDQLIHPAASTLPNKELIVADYNCPGGTRMFLTSDPNKKEAVKVDLTKVQKSTFPDEWNFIFDNYQQGANDPAIIDSVSLIAFNPPPQISPLPKQQPVAAVPPKPTAQQTANTPPLVFLDRKELEKSEPQKTRQEEKKTEIKIPPVVTSSKKTAEVMVKVSPPSPPVLPPTNEEKFTKRKKEFALEIPVSGDSIELKFYDNAEVDGDSISLFLNNKMLFEHIRLTASAHVIKLSVYDLSSDNELVMVAENLGSIPPNTAYMIVMVGDKKYDAQIVSTETSSALIRLKRE